MAHILLVEPDKLLARSYVGALEGAGHAVSHARSAQDGIAAADAHRPDVVLLELQIPAHSGVEFLYEFKSYAEWADIPVIVLTTLPAPQLQEFAVLREELSVSVILEKKRTDLTALRAAVGSVLDAQP